MYSLLIGGHDSDRRVRVRRRHDDQASVTNAFVQGQRGTECTPRGRSITCQLLPIANGASAPLSVLMTDLTPGTVRIQVSAVSAYYNAPVMRSAISLKVRVLPCVHLVRAAGGAQCR
jgi:hypothetical protein